MKNEFENFIFEHFDTDSEFVDELHKKNPRWNSKKFSRIKLGIQEPKIGEVYDMAMVTKTPIAEVAQFFLG